MKVHLESTELKFLYIESWCKYTWTLKEEEKKPTLTNFKVL